MMLYIQAYFVIICTCISVHAYDGVVIIIHRLSYKRLEAENDDTDDEELAEVYIHTPSMV